MNTLASHLAAFSARAPTSEDAGFLARLYASTRTDLLGTGADPAFAASLIAMQQRLQGAGYRNSFPDAHYLLLHDASGAPVARIVVDHGQDQLRLVDIALLPEARGNGFGSAVLRALQQWAALHGLPLALSVHRSNPGARRLYLALGFALEGGDAWAERLSWRP